MLTSDEMTVWPFHQPVKGISPSPGTTLVAFVSPGFSELFSSPVFQLDLLSQQFYPLLMIQMYNVVFASALINLKQLHD